MKHEKLPPSFIQDAKNFSVVTPLNSGEAVASPASPVPRPLFIFDALGHCDILLSKISVPIIFDRYVCT